MPRDLEDSTPDELKEALSSLDTLTDSQFLDIIRLNLIAEIPLASYSLGLSLEYMTKRLEAIGGYLKQLEEAGTD